MTIRVVIWNVPTMLGEILNQILAADAELELITTNGTETSLAEFIQDHLPDVIITGLTDDELDSSCTGFLVAQTSRKVLGISSDGRSAFLYRLRPELISLGEISQELLLQAIRAPASWH